MVSNGRRMPVRSRDLGRETRLGETVKTLISLTRFELDMIDQLAHRWNVSRSAAIVQACHAMSSYQVEDGRRIAICANLHYVEMGEIREWCLKHQTSMPKFLERAVEHYMKCEHKGYHGKAS